MICTGNPEQLWAYDEPNYLSETQWVNRHVVMSEKEILGFMKVYHEDDYNKAEIRLHKIISDEDKIDDWICVHWAYKVNNET